MSLEDLEEEWVAQQATHPAHRPSSPMDESNEENPCPFYVYTVEVSDISDDEEGGDSKEDDSKEDEEDDSKDDDSKDDDDDSKEDEEDDAMDDGISK